MPCAFITGVSGQDGSYMAELLLHKGYTVYGMTRRSSNMSNLKRIRSIRDHERLKIHYGDITDLASVIKIMNLAYNDESKLGSPLHVYNFAAQSHVRVSFDVPIYTAQSDGIGVLNVLEAIIQLPDYSPSSVRFYQASTSELYGSTPGPQNENTLMRPQSPYGVAKLYAYWIVNNYRDIYNGFFVNGILFNHESERRPENFVTRKITSYVAHYANVKVVEPLRLGNLYSKRDWGYAKDYVSAMYMMLEQDHPEDFVVSTGECHTVKDFVNEAFKCIGVNVEWSGSGLSEVGIDSKTSKPIIVIDSNYFRPTEVDYLLGDATKAKEKLGWKPETTFRELVSIMVSHDQDNISKNSHGTSS